jgi:glycosyltransferase involved in cell wall biosynthesis
MFLPAILRAGPARYYRGYNIGYWAWELESLPGEWIRGLDYLDAVLVPSQFCRRTVARYTRKPVLVVPHPIQNCPVPNETPRTDGRFQVVTIFNFGSSFERKNPLAVIAAFSQAYGTDPHALLVLKTADGRRYPQDLARLRAAIGEAPNVKLVDEVWPEDRLMKLIRTSDAYISLHRSEGFGLTLAEAMLMETPLIATGWSGNMDFCHAEQTHLVEFDLVPFRDEHPDYSEVVNGRWAEPSIASAAAQLRRVRQDPSAARRKARTARQELVRHLEANTYPAALARLAAGGALTGPGLRASERTG